MNEQAAMRERRPSRFSSGIFTVIFVVVAGAVITYGAVDPLAASGLAVATALIVLLRAADAWRSGKLRLASDGLVLPLAGLIMIGLIQLLPLAGDRSAADILTIPAASALSLDPYATRMFVLGLVSLLIFFCASLTELDTARRIRKAVIFLIAFGTLMGFFGILQKLADPGAIYGLRPTPQAIPFGPYVNQHHFASLMVMLSGPVIGLLAARSVKRDIMPLLLIATVMMAAAVVFTGSRGGVLSYAAMTGIVLAVGSRHRLIRERSDGRSRRFSFGAAIAGAVILVLAVVGVAIFLGAGDNLLRGVGVGSPEDDISSGRLHFWNVALQIFYSHPVLGAGLDAFSVAFTQFDTRNGFFRVEQAHNEYLQILADAGIAGFACIAAFIVIFIKRGIGSIRAAAGKADLGVRLGAFAGCVGVLVHSFFDFPLRTTANSYVFLLLVVLAVQQVPLDTLKRSSKGGF